MEIYTNLIKSDPLFKAFKQTLVEIPAPTNISIWWNFGSLLGLCLIIQIVTGIFLAFQYSNHIEYAFSRVVHISQDISYGWLVRNLHANGASFFFLCLYLHLGRNIYYRSYFYFHTWIIGVSLLLLVIATAFLGYVLPWGQISLWGATVITNLLSSIPYIGTSLTQWLWGGTSVEAPTLTRFFAFHFICPFIVAAIVIIHIIFLHQTGSNNPLGIQSKYNKVTIHPYFIIKDRLGFLILIILLTLISLANPFILGDPENFNPANPINSPIHIKPEWYYLFAYAILRSIPNKLGGVLALIMSVFILYCLPFLRGVSKCSTSFYPLNQILFWRFLSIVSLLTWIGANPVEHPYILTGQILTIRYFLYFIITPNLIFWWDNNLNPLK